MDWYPRLEKRILGEPVDEEPEALLGGSIEEAWARSLAVWRVRGRVEDFRKGVRIPRYQPDFGKELGLAFAEKFLRQFRFVIGRLSSADIVEVLCAYEILEIILGEHLRRKGRGESEVPQELLEITAPLPPELVREIRSDWIFKGFHGRTIGEFFRFLDREGSIG
jgi:hypothetical protein